jgi:Uma2 family endonuclease
MATILQSTAELMQIAPLHRFTTADYLEMIDKGVLGPEDKVELIGGVIVEMSPAGIQHNHFHINIVELFAPLLGRYKFAVQGTLSVAESHVYDPDFMLLRQRPDNYKLKLPSAADVQLLIEAADSSMARDGKIKLPAYAAANIPEYWIADLNRQVLMLYRDSDGTTYQFAESRRADEIASPLAAPDFSFAVRQMFD